MRRSVLAAVVPSDIAACSANPAKACLSKGLPQGEDVRAVIKSPEAAASAAAAARRGAAPAPPVPAGRASQAGDRIPGAPRREESGAFAMLFRPSGVGYVVSSDGMLHVLGLASGKDLQRPAPFPACQRPMVRARCC